jgi:hypothetical protein
MSAVSSFDWARETRARVLQTATTTSVWPLSDRRKFPQRHTKETQKKSTKHRAPDRSPRPRPSSRRRRKTSLFLLCVYSLFFFREGRKPRSKFVLNSLLSRSPVKGSKKKKEKKEKRTPRATARRFCYLSLSKRKKKKKKKALKSTTMKGAKSVNHY